MILAAGLLVLAGLGLFVGGVLTGVTALYWGCVAACVVAAVLLLLARRQIATAPAKAPAAPGPPPAERTTAGTTTAPAADEGETAGAAAGATAASAAETAVEEPVAEAGDPPVEEVEVTDLLIVVDLKDEVLVVDEHPRYHLAGCRYLAGHTPIPLPLDEARTDGFTPCAVCAPDRNLAQRARDAKAAG
ncbi:hypothetical protein [Blastococcus litoris]|uniref:hypothetical protein n=1 Tax=Blastococcus litoris TaxID=2171622 RepID=UPI000E302E6A|nr:hypothetical protein [Blastococcus litoris]